MQVQPRAVPHWPVEVKVSARTETVPVFVMHRAGGAERINGPTKRASQTMRGCSKAMGAILERTRQAGACNAKDAATKDMLAVQALREAYKEIAYVAQHPGKLYKAPHIRWM